MSEEKEELKCGTVAIVGRPNVGKSTLLNQILDEKVAIVSKIPQTTRNQIRGIYNDEQGQLILIDTPGAHSGKDKLDHFMNQASSGVIDEVDCIIYLVDTSRRIGEEEKRIAQKLANVKPHIIFGLNKVDLKSKTFPEYIAFWEKIKGKSVTEMDDVTLMSLSGKENINIDDLISVIYEKVPVGPLLYERDTICDIPQKQAVADIIREKFFNIMRNEVPHALGVFIEEMVPVKGKTMKIKALIMVERSTHKEIVIGKNGQVLKKIGIEAREELEELLQTKVFLEFFVKVQKNWRDNLGVLQDLGYTN